MVLNPVNVLPMVVFLHDQSSDRGSVCQDNQVQLLHNGTVLHPVEKLLCQECHL
jgi:hypothetical protein